MHRNVTGTNQAETGKSLCCLILEQFTRKSCKLIRNVVLRATFLIVIEGDMLLPLL
jgi:hypothetical protein